MFGVRRAWLLRRDELTAALDAKSDANCQLEGLKELAKQLQADNVTVPRCLVPSGRTIESIRDSSTHHRINFSSL